MVDRIITALTPVLKEEIDRILGEARQKLEAEFSERLQAAVREAESATRAKADAEHKAAHDRAVRETRESVRAEVTREVTREVSEALQAQFQQTLATRDSEQKKTQSAWEAERDRMKERLQQWRVFAEAQRQLTDANSQPEMLARCLKLAEPFASSVAVYTAKADGLALWKSRGKAVFPEVISEQITDPESYFKPVVVRGKTVAAVSAVKPFQAEVLDFLTSSMERAIVVFGLKLRAPAGKPGAPEAARTT